MPQPGNSAAAQTEPSEGKKRDKPSRSFYLGERSNQPCKTSSSHESASLVATATRVELRGRD